MQQFFEINLAGVTRSEKEVNAFVTDFLESATVTLHNKNGETMTFTTEEVQALFAPHEE